MLGNHELRLGDVMPLRKALVEAGLTTWADAASKSHVRGMEMTIRRKRTALVWRCADDSALRTPHSALSHPPVPHARSTPLGQSQRLRSDARRTQSWRANSAAVSGALITPSKYGCRYAGGLYYEPPTLLHVSRGLAGTHLIRLNCPPELALLTLRSEPVVKLDSCRRLFRFR